MSVYVRLGKTKAIILRFHNIVLILQQLAFSVLTLLNDIMGKILLRPVGGTVLSGRAMVTVSNDDLSACKTRLFIFRKVTFRDLKGHLLQVCREQAKTVRKSLRYVTNRKLRPRRGTNDNHAKGLLPLALALFTVTNAGAVSRSDSVYRCLDKAIAESDKYIARYESRINGLKRRLATARSAASRYGIEFELYDRYKSFDNDSAIAYLDRAISSAAKAGNAGAANRCKALAAFQCSTSGMYKESLDILNSIDRGALNHDGLTEYYMAWHHLYDQLGFYSKVERLKRAYETKAGLYADSLLSVADRNSPLYLQTMENRMYDKGDYRAALRYNDTWMKLYGNDPEHFAVIAFYRFLDYKMLGNEDEWTYWLAMSSLYDVRNATMDQASMWELANHFYTTGDKERAYNYIDFAWKCADRFHTRVRSEQILPAFTAINNIYRTSITRTNHYLTTLLAGISLLAALMFAMLVYVNKQRKRLAAARNELSRKNGQLTDLNAEMKATLDNLDSTNRRLTATGNRLNDAIAGLDESNRVKEKYIGLFLRQCSSYIDKMDRMRKETFSMLKNKRYNELYDLMRPYDFRSHEQKELFEIFDSTFIRLFPTFVDEFNRLLKPEFRIQLTDTSRLNTDIRIFALIRLGIDDSSKIAEFLHYSVNTIYNYRARIKSGAACDRDHFEDYVKEIGMPGKSTGGG